MTEHDPDDVTLHTLHEDMSVGFADMRDGFADLKAEMRAGFADLKATMITGFGRLPTRESSEEMVRLLREGNRLSQQRFTELDAGLREQHLETQQVLHALAESHSRLAESHGRLAEEQRLLVEELRRLGADQRSLSGDIRALIVRLDALFRPRANGEPPA